MNLITEKSNSIGAIASLVCLIHCLATPFLFIAKLSDSCCEASPTWWTGLDYLFLVIAFFAVYQSTRLTTNKKIAIGLWVSLSLLFFVIINEKVQLLYLPENAIYVPTLSLIFLHIYNRKFCRCETDQCCGNNTDKL